MLLGLSDLLFTDPLKFLLALLLVLATVGVALLVGITVHEFSHALMAHRLGDDTARRLARLSLNPLAHLDPMGTVMLLLVGFGWGKPVPVNPSRLRIGPRKGMALVGLAGPLSNIAMASLVALPIKLGLLPWRTPFAGLDLSGGVEGALAAFLALVVFYNLVLAVFNLLPIPPLDGFQVALGVLPHQAARSFARLAPYGPAVLLVLVLVDFTTGLGLLGRVLMPLVGSLESVIAG